MSEIKVLEEHFLDELDFKLSAVLSIMRLGSKEQEAMKSFASQLHELTHENITRLNKIL